MLNVFGPKSFTLSIEYALAVSVITVNHLFQFFFLVHSSISVLIFWETTSYFWASDTSFLLVRLGKPNFSNVNQHDTHKGLGKTRADSIFMLQMRVHFILIHFFM